MIMEYRMWISGFCIGISITILVNKFLVKYYNEKKGICPQCDQKVLIK